MEGVDVYGPAVLDLIGLGLEPPEKVWREKFPSYICRMEYVCLSIAVVAFICRYGRGIV
jgi:hypothetical protein